MSDKAYGMVTPCDQCPFRNDIDPYLREGRVREIERSLDRGEFPCHKTVEHDEDGEPIHSGEQIHCAGALILMEKEGRSSQMMRIAERIGIYDPSKLNMGAPVFGSFNEMAKAMRKNKPRK